MDSQPVALALQFGFLAVLYLFLLWVSRSALRELRRTASPAPEATGLHSAIGSGSRKTTVRDAHLVVVDGAGLQPGERFDLFGGLTIGRSAEADVQIADRYASGRHMRVFSRGSDYIAEDLDSTNGTFLNADPLRGEERLSDQDTIRIGDTELRFELDMPEYE